MEVFTPEEVAKKLKINLQTVRKFLREGKLKGIKVGTNWRIPEDRFNEFLQKGTGESEE